MPRLRPRGPKDVKPFVPTAAQIHVLARIEADPNRRLTGRQALSVPVLVRAGVIELFGELSRFTVTPAGKKLLERYEAWFAKQPEPRTAAHEWDEKYALPRPTPAQKRVLAELPCPRAALERGQHRRALLFRMQRAGLIAVDDVGIVRAVFVSTDERIARWIEARAKVRATLCPTKHTAVIVFELETVAHEIRAGAWKRGSGS